MMEVDMQSPSSSLRPAYGSTKRARSPDETNSPSRPSKRLTLATEIEYNPSQPIYLRSSSSAGSSRQPSEDWVQQAGSLTIDSPLCTGASGGLPFEDYAMAADQPVVAKSVYRGPSNCDVWKTTASSITNIFLSAVRCPSRLCHCYSAFTSSCHY
ncbi:hypothetical protein HHX47_DHR1000826 [Lentinula edodes]|nr:hypothetical protein HHX47_DHR1000826 [Lentinula edodes]